MNQVSKNQALFVIFETVKKAPVDRESSLLVADLAACGQTILFGPDSEAGVAWVEAQNLMRQIELRRIRFSVSHAA